MGLDLGRKALVQLGSSGPRLGAEYSVGHQEREQIIDPVQDKAGHQRLSAEYFYLELPI